MSKITGKETKIEITVRKYLFSKGFRYRKNDKRYPGKPDIVLPKYKTMIFIHGCFWHGHNCKAAALPKSNYQFWEEKIKNNINRDKKNIKQLKSQDWKIIILWQCELNTKDKTRKRLDRLMEEIIKK